MSPVNRPPAPAVFYREEKHPRWFFHQLLELRRTVYFAGAVFLVVVLVLSGTSFSQTALNLLGTSTPAIVDSGNAQPYVLGVKVFSDVPGQVLGCSFYKAPTNTGAHVVSLWDSAGKLLATQVPTTETASGKQLVLFSSPVPIAANQTFTCGYYAPNGHYSLDKSAFVVQKDVAPLHVPVNGGVFVSGTQATAWPTTVWRSSSYGVDVLFLPSTGSATWITAANVSPTSNGAGITWNTAVPSDSQVEYGPTTSYGNSSALASARVTSHAGHHRRPGARNHVSLPGTFKRRRRGAGGRS